MREYLQQTSHIIIHTYFPSLDPFTREINSQYGQIVVTMFPNMISCVHSAQPVASTRKPLCSRSHNFFLTLCPQSKHAALLLSIRTE